MIMGMESEVRGLLERVRSPEDAGYRALVEALHERFAGTGTGGSYFPISRIRESGRRLRRELTIPDEQLVLWLRAEADAILCCMAASTVSGVATVGKTLQRICRALDSEGKAAGVILRLVDINGIPPEALPTGELRDAAEPALAELKDVLEPIRTEMEEQYLKPRGEITAILEQARDGQPRLLMEAVARDRQRLAIIAGQILQREKPGISVSADDLVQSVVLKVRSDPDQVPLNRLMLEELSRTIMRHILADRGRKKIPGGGNLKGEFSEEGLSAGPAAGWASRDRTPLEPLLRNEVLLVAVEVIRKLGLKSTNPDEARIMREWLLEGGELKELARRYGIPYIRARRLAEKVRNMYKAIYLGSRLRGARRA